MARVLSAVAATAIATAAVAAAPAASAEPPHLLSNDADEAVADKYTVLLAQLKKLLSKGVEPGVHPLNASNFEANDLFYGPVHVECAELVAAAMPDSDTSGATVSDARTVVDWSAPGWAPEGRDAGLSVRSISKVFANVVVLELAERGAGPQLTTRLADVFPECGSSPDNLLHDATLEQLLNMATRMDLRTAAFEATAHPQFPEAVYSAPDTHPCELAGLPSHGDCVRRLICPAYGHHDIVEAVRRAPESFGPGGPFALTSAPFVDTVCAAEDNPEFRTRCSRWASQGFCHTNAAFMLASCSATCKVCSFMGPPGTPPCQDAPDCPVFVHG
jgi:hypothetical protein